MSQKLYMSLSTSALHSAKLDGVARDANSAGFPLDDLISLAAEAVYYRLHLATDKYGTMPGSERDVMSRAFPSRGVDADMVAELVDLLDRDRLIERWTEEDGEHEGAWLHMRNHDRFTSAEYKAKRRRYTPVPPSQRPVPDPFRASSGPVPGTHATAPVPDRSGPVPVPSIGVGVESTLTRPRAELDHLRGIYHRLGFEQITEAEFLDRIIGASAHMPIGLPLLTEVERQNAETVETEKFVPADQRTGSARSESPAADGRGLLRAVGPHQPIAADAAIRPDRPSSDDVASAFDGAAVADAQPAPAHNQPLDDSRIEGGAA